MPLRDSSDCVQYTTRDPVFCLTGSAELIHKQNSGIMFTDSSHLNARGYCTSKSLTHHFHVYNIDHSPVCQPSVRQQTHQQLSLLSLTSLSVYIHFER